MQVVVKTKDDKIIELMCQILDLSEASEILVKETIKEKSLTYFFDTYQEMDLSMEEMERIQALICVIEAKRKEIQEREAGEAEMIMDQRETIESKYEMEGDGNYGQQ